MCAVRLAHAYMREPARSTTRAMSQLRARAWSNRCAAQGLQSTQRRVAYSGKQQRGRLLRGRKHAAGGIDEIIMLHAAQRIQGSKRSVSLELRRRALRRQQTLQRRRRRVALYGEGFVRKTSCTGSVKRKSAVPHAGGIFYACGALCARRLACTRRGTETCISMVFKTVCPSSTTGTRKKCTAVSSGSVGAADSSVERRVGQAKGVSQLRVAKRAAAPGEVSSLVERDPNVDARCCPRGLRLCCRCSAFRPWTQPVAAAGRSSEEVERRKDDGPGQHEQKTLRGPEHEGNRHQQTRNTRLSSSRPSCRGHGSCSMGRARQPDRRAQGEQQACAHRCRIVWTELPMKGATFLWRSSMHLRRSHSKALGSAEGSSAGQREEDEEEQQTTGGGGNATDASGTRQESSAEAVRRWKSAYTCHSMAAQGGRTTAAGEIAATEARGRDERQEAAATGCDALARSPSVLRVLLCRFPVGLPKRPPPLPPQPPRSAAVGPGAGPRSRFLGGVRNQSDTPQNQLREEKRWRHRTLSNLESNIASYDVCCSPVGESIFRAAGEGSRFRLCLRCVIYFVCARMGVRLRGGVRKAGFPMTAPSQTADTLSLAAPLCCRC